MATCREASSVVAGVVVDHGHLVIDRQSGSSWMLRWTSTWQTLSTSELLRLVCSLVSWYAWHWMADDNFGAELLWLTSVPIRYFCSVQCNWYFSELAYHIERSLTVILYDTVTWLCNKQKVFEYSCQNCQIWMEVYSSTPCPHCRLYLYILINYLIITQKVLLVGLPASKYFLWWTNTDTS